LAIDHGGERIDEDQDTSGSTTARIGTKMGSEQGNQQLGKTKESDGS
jgi:hypothetical protein